MNVDKYLTEGEENVIYEAEKLELKQVADAFTRYMIGDRKVAVAQLNKLKEKGFGSAAEDDLDFNDYSKQYDALYTKILKAIK